MFQYTVMKCASPPHFKLHKVMYYNNIIRTILLLLLLLTLKLIVIFLLFLLLEQLKLTETELGERVLRGENKAQLSLPVGPSRKRKQLTQEQLDDRRKKVLFEIVLFCYYTRPCASLTCLEGGSKGKANEIARRTGKKKT